MFWSIVQGVLVVILVFLVLLDLRDHVKRGGGWS